MSLEGEEREGGVINPQNASLEPCSVEVQHFGTLWCDDALGESSCWPPLPTHPPEGNQGSRELMLPRLRHLLWGSQGLVCALKSSLCIFMLSH